MFSLPARQASSSPNQPFTYTSFQDPNVSGLFNTISANAMSDRPTGPPGGASLAIESSLAARLSADKSPTTLTTSSRAPTTTATTETTTAASVSAASTSSASSADPASSSSASEPTTTAATTTALSDTVITSAASSAVTSSLTSEVANTTSTLAQSTGSSMSSGTKAAIAVPVVVVALAAIVFAILCVRRRRKKQRQEPGDSIEKVPLAVKKKKWTRHLRIFSFDTELLMGGRYSSTNSIRSRQTGSVRSQTPSHHSNAASIHSVEEIAPPYRDAVSSAQPPSIAQVMAGAAATGTMTRSTSSATAPPPYGAAAGRVATPTTPRSTRDQRNPFTDSPPVSPIDGSPFNDPPETSPPISRNSSLYRTEREETSTLGGVSDAASIREATLARNASVMSGGRIINNVNRS